MTNINDLNLDIRQVEEALAKIKKAIANARPESIKIIVTSDTIFQIGILNTYSQRCVTDMQRLFEK